MPDKWEKAQTQLSIDVHSIANMPAFETDRLQELVNVYNSHAPKNSLKSKYYEGNIPLSDVNLGIALPNNLSGLEIGCAWGAKTVDVLAARSMFDGYVGANGEEASEMKPIAEENHLISQYQKACRDELKYGCTFATLAADQNLGCKIRFHSPCSAAALWDGEKGRIGCGFAIIDSVKDESLRDTWRPSLINYYTDNAVWVLKRSGDLWSAEFHQNKMGIPLMVPMIWNATMQKPFGRSRIKEPIRRLIDGYIRTVANATIGLEFATSPQKYLIGITDEQYDAVISNKFKQYVGSIIASTSNPETGNNPQFGQLQQGNIQPHVEMMRMLATQFSAATGLTVSDTGVVNDANPTSSDAILAQSQTLVLLAQQLNETNGDALKQIALMAQAIAHNSKLDELEENEREVVAHFKNPAMPSVAVTADAAIKIASARQYFSSTDTFLEMIGFDQADIRRIKAQEQRARGSAILTDEFSQQDKNQE